jgi:EAL domain-containing protein (putative c-di-GMP-specific phosphodiesterase class I)
VEMTGCNACKQGISQPFAFSMAFQPIVDIEAGQVFAYEALVRGMNGESAHSILSQLTAENRYAFDQNCRVVALTLASRLGLAATGARLSINFMPGAVYSPAACIQLTLRTAKLVNFPLDQLIFEITEGEEVVDRKHLRSIIEEYQRQGFAVAVDDFGAGYSGMNLIADLPTNIIKLDMDLIRSVHERPAAMAVVRAMVGLAKDLGARLIAEGVEAREEYRALRACGIELMQGYLLAKPMFEGLPTFTIPVVREDDVSTKRDNQVEELVAAEDGANAVPFGLKLIKKTA